MSDSEIEVAHRHVQEERKIVPEQWERVRSLKEHGHNVKDAERILSLFEQSLAIFEEHLREIEGRAPTAASSATAPSDRPGLPRLS
jgi:DNA invertase Pin-like site-specific DNA recombinase